MPGGLFPATMVSKVLRDTDSVGNGQATAERWQVCAIQRQWRRFPARGRCETQDRGHLDEGGNLVDSKEAADGREAN